jgi:two-component system, chemotaxis family, protein-glutamate methylesterase/glutaminase
VKGRCFIFVSSAGKDSPSRNSIVLAQRKQVMQQSAAGRHIHRTDTRDIVVIGGSAGGVEGLSKIVAGLPKDLPAAIFVSLHFPPRGVSVLPQILSRAGPLPASHPTDGQTIEHGHVYVAAPDRHLMLARRGFIRLLRGPTENGARPAIDPMFRSAAVAYGPRVIGVVITGNLDDGTAGLLAIKRRQGIAVVQDPHDALFPSMPASAIAHVDADHVVRLDEIPSLISRLVREPIDVTQEVTVPDDAPRENAYSEFDLDVIEDPDRHPGKPSTFACPDCGGVLWQIKDGDLLRFRCRVGHGWTSDGLLDKQHATLEAALWSGLRALEESVALSEQMAQRIERRGNLRIAERYRASSELAARRAAVIRSVLLSTPGGTSETAVVELVEHASSPTGAE